MAKSANQKRKILLLERILEQTDENHPIGMRDIIEKLAAADIQAERKSIYGDLDELRNVGMNILFRKGKPTGYYLNQSPENRTYDPLMETACTEELAEMPEKTDESIKQSVVAENWEKTEGDYIEVQLRCKKSAVPNLRGRYGENCRILKEEEKHVTAEVPEIPGNAFYGWLTAQGGAVKIIKPKETAKEYRRLLKKLLEGYKKQ
ncbi:MAG: WYL domain-containing protein [Oliverpabstia sp.]